MPRSSGEAYVSILKISKMDILLYTAITSFLIGCFCCHFFWKWYQSAKIHWELERLKSEKISAEFNMDGGVTYYRPFRLGKVQEGSEGSLSALSKVCIIQHKGYLELYGSWDRNNKNQIDPFTFYLPTENVDPDNLVKFGEYFTDLGNKLNKKYENA